MYKHKLDYPSISEYIENEDETQIQMDYSKDRTLDEQSQDFFTNLTADQISELNLSPTGLTPEASPDSSPAPRDSANRRVMDTLAELSRTSPEEEENGLLSQIFGNNEPPGEEEEEMKAILAPTK